MPTFQMSPPQPPPYPPPQAGEGPLIYPPPLAGEGREGLILIVPRPARKPPGSRISCAIGSIQLHPSALCDLRPFLDLDADEDAKFRSCHRQRRDSLLRPRL